jgi:hypothetical protein
LIRQVRQPLDASRLRQFGRLPERLPGGSALATPAQMGAVLHKDPGDQGPGSNLAAERKRAGIRGVRLAPLLHQLRALGMRQRDHHSWNPAWKCRDAGLEAGEHSGGIIKPEGAPIGLKGVSHPGHDARFEDSAPISECLDALEECARLSILVSPHRQLRVDVP